MLRTALLGIAALLLVLGLGLMLAGLPPGTGMAVLGGMLLLALLVERWRYRRIDDTVPGPDWQATGERFREPGSDRVVTVYFHPRTGRRAYVRSRDTAG